MAHVDIVDRIKAIVDAEGWKFTFGEVDVKNLITADAAAGASFTTVRTL